MKYGVVKLDVIRSEEMKLIYDRMANVVRRYATHIRSGQQHLEVLLGKHTGFWSEGVRQNTEERKILTGS